MSAQIEPGCAGFVVFSSDHERVVLVETHRGHLGFPKGKRHKGETLEETAYRELKEETGLTNTDIIVFPELGYFDELSNKGNPNIRYYVCHTINDNFNFTFDEDELKEVKWYDCNTIDELENLKDSRKLVFNNASQQIC